MVEPHLGRAKQHWRYVEFHLPATRLLTWVSAEISYVESFHQRLQCLRYQRPVRVSNDKDGRGETQTEITINDWSTTLLLVSSNEAVISGTRTRYTQLSEIGTSRNGIRSNSCTTNLNASLLEVITSILLTKLEQYFHSNHGPTNRHHYRRGANLLPRSIDGKPGDLAVTRRFARAQLRPQCRRAEAVQGVL